MYENIKMQIKVSLLSTRMAALPYYANLIFHRQNNIYHLCSLVVLKIIQNHSMERMKDKILNQNKTIES